MRKNETISTKMFALLIVTLWTRKNSVFGHFSYSVWYRFPSKILYKSWIKCIFCVTISLSKEFIQNFFALRESWYKIVRKKFQKSSNIFISLQKPFFKKVIAASSCRIYVVADNLVSRSFCNIISLLHVKYFITWTWVLMNWAVITYQTFIPVQILKNRSESSCKYERSNSQISSLAIDLLIYSIIAPDLGLLVNQVVWKRAPWMNWV